jgi:hypothetical protein
VERVICRFRGSGRVFRRGWHLRQGQLIKNGPVERSLTILLDEPIADLHFGDETSIIHIPSDEVEEWSQTRWDELVEQSQDRVINSAAQLLFGQR